MTLTSARSSPTLQFRTMVPGPAEAASVNELKVPWVGGFVPLIGAMLTHLTVLRKRGTWLLGRKQYLGPWGRLFSLIVAAPNKLHAIVSVTAMFSSVAYIATAGFGQRPSEGTLRRLSDVNEAWYVWILVVWLLNVVLLYVNAVGRTLLWLCGRVPKLRETVEWSNASWHLDNEDSVETVAVHSGDGLPGAILEKLSASMPNKNRALRPAGLDDEEAANVLYFGHVIEAALADANEYWSEAIWTEFYERLGKVAIQPARPFAASALSAPDGASFSERLLAEFERRSTETLPPLAAEVRIVIESRIDAALEHLKQYQFDARKLGRDWNDFTYAAALKHARESRVLGGEGMCRQFAKLGIIWRIWPQPIRPDTFRIPFNTDMARYLLAQGWIRTEGKRFSTDDQRFVVAFEVAQASLLRRTIELLERSKNSTVSAWRAQQQSAAEDLGVDWDWYAQYLIDQHVYHVARNAKSEGWTRSGTIIERTS